MVNRSCNSRHLLRRSLLEAGGLLLAAAYFGALIYVLDSLLS